jgi:anti-anti-sigma regulatory factor
MATAVQLSLDSARFAFPSTQAPYHAKDIRARVRRALQDGDRHLVVDCEGWTDFDLRVLSSLLQCAAVCREHGASFEIANLSNDIRANVRDLQLAHRLGILD